jgi:alkylhydroperoxidase family enzyme
MNTTKKGFSIHTIESAPNDSRPTLEAVQKAWSFVPNLQRVMAEAPATLQAYTMMWDLFSKTRLSPLEQQVVYLTAIYENDCHYCMAGHTALSKMQKLPDEVVNAIRDGRPIADQKLEALRRFVSEMVTTRGWPSATALSAFHANGYDRRQALEVVLGVATKIISNYTNHLADTPLDEFMKATAWSKAK